MIRTKSERLVKTPVWFSDVLALAWCGSAPFGALSDHGGTAVRKGYLGHRQVAQEIHVTLCQSHPNSSIRTAKLKASANTHPLGMQ
jgi:hypothetical protein